MTSETKKEPGIFSAQRALRTETLECLHLIKETQLPWLQPGAAEI